MKAHFRMMAAYNAWANRRLYAAAAALPEGALDTDLGAFFGSVLGTLDHLLVADLIWIARFQGQPVPPLRLDQRLHDRLAPLRAARQALDRQIADHVDGLTEAQLEAELAYSTLSGQQHNQPRREALAHFFNHQTHHRGQAHALLTRLTGEAPVLDLLYFQREDRCTWTT